MRKSLVVNILLFGLLCSAQTTESFYSRFGSTEDEIGNGIVQALNGGYLIVGQTTSYGASQTDVLITKTNDLGIPVWIKNYGGFNADIGKALTELSDSSIVFVGYTNSFGSGGYDALITRIDKNGNQIWQKTYGGLDWDFGYSINKTTDGNIIVCGATYSFGRGDKDGFILKMDAVNGNILWNKVFGGKKEDDFKKIIQTNEGGFIATGTTKSYGDSLGDIWVAKFNSNGDSTWFVTRGGAKKEVGNSIVQDKNNDYLICGGSESFTFGKEDAYVFKLANNNSFVWDNHFGLAGEDEEAYDITNTNSTFGTMVITLGWKASFGTGLDIYTIVLSNVGYYINGGTFGGPKDEVGYSIFNTKDKGFVAVGYTENFNSTLKDVFIVKYDSQLTIGPLVISVKEISKISANSKIYPTIISENYFFIETENENSPLKLEVINILGAIVDNVKMEKINSNLYKIIVPEGLKGLVLINLNNGEFIKKCLIQ